MEFLVLLEVDALASVRSRRRQREDVRGVIWVTPTGSAMLIPFRASTLKWPIGQSIAFEVKPPRASATA